ncbi:hypothetical protein [Pseudomonas fluorescens]|uniref:Uncharacterized protein n=1 Tax=Pseudomonas fluorescens TaxID=294 RepID=A0A5E7SSH4_PSEFL|nr:hypothetical protein [Pseudomonas fluorescens]VVP89054.1 hypothetical protein PS928_01478 [Pseudomonas fluorescens]
MKVKTVSASETAYILRSKLGAVRAFDDLLADMRRGRSTYFGLVLVPFLCSHDGKGTRPYYSLSEINDFVRAALRVAPSSTAMVPIQVREWTCPYQTGHQLPVKLMLPLSA